MSDEFFDSRTKPDADKPRVRLSLKFEVDGIKKTFSRYSNYIYLNVALVSPVRVDIGEKLIFCDYRYSEKNYKLFAPWEGQKNHVSCSMMIYRLNDEEDDSTGFSFVEFHEETEFTDASLWFQIRLKDSQFDSLESSLMANFGIDYVSVSIIGGDDIVEVPSVDGSRRSYVWSPKWMPHNESARSFCENGGVEIDSDLWRTLNSPRLPIEDYEISSKLFEPANTNPPASGVESVPIVDPSHFLLSEKPVSAILNKLDFVAQLVDKLNGRLLLVSFIFVVLGIIILFK